MSDTKKPSIFIRLPLRIAKWFREMRSELKKVSWPSLRQVINNTGIVLVMIAIVGVTIAAFDTLWSFTVKTVILTLRGS